MKIHQSKLMKDMGLYARSYNISIVVFNLGKHQNFKNMICKLSNKVRLLTI